MTMPENPSEGETPSADTDRLVELATRRRRVPDELAVSVTRGGRVLVFGDLRMVPGGSDVSREASRAIARVVK